MQQSANQIEGKHISEGSEVASNLPVFENSISSIKFIEEWKEILLVS